MVCLRTSNGVARERPPRAAVRTPSDLSSKILPSPQAICTNCFSVVGKILREAKSGRLAELGCIARKIKYYFILQLVSIDLKIIYLISNLVISNFPTHLQKRPKFGACLLMSDYSICPSSDSH